MTGKPQSEESRKGFAEWWASKECTDAMRPGNCASFGLAAWQAGCAWVLERAARIREDSVSDETGWLLEKAPDKNGIPYLGVVDGLLGWTYDPNKALRLSRREDADKLCEIVEDCDKITEHCWPGAEARGGFNG